MSWSSRKKKEGIFCTVYFTQREIFHICVLAQCIVYWINFQNIHAFTYQETLLHTLLLLVFKIVESLQCILEHSVLVLVKLGNEAYKLQNQAILKECSNLLVEIFKIVLPNKRNKKKQIKKNTVGITLLLF